MSATTTKPNEPTSPPTTFTPSPSPSNSTTTFPYPLIYIGVAWALIGLAYLICRWRQKTKQLYIIPRVFVLCSPRTVQYQYELILRIGLPSGDFNPDKNDIDITVLGLQRNEVVPLTRLNTKTLLDEPLITSLSIIVYRLVEMPQLGMLVLKHSGQFKACVFAYDFTVIDLNTNREQYYTINHYIGSLNKIYRLDEPSESVNARYPIDDVPLPAWNLEDVFLTLFAVTNSLMLCASLMPIGCTILYDIVAIVLVSINGLSVAFFLNWFLYYNLRWSQDRHEYFNQNEFSCCGFDYLFRWAIILLALAIGAAATASSYKIDQFHDSLIWLLVTVNAGTLVLGLWNYSRQAQLGEALVGFGLKLRKITTIPVGMRQAEYIPSMLSKSGSASDEEGIESAVSSTQNSQIVRSIGPRSSVKSFGFDLAGQGLLQSRSNLGAVSGGSSATGATPSNHTIAKLTFARKLAKANKVASATDNQESHSNSLKRVAGGIGDGSAPVTNWSLRPNTPHAQQDSGSGSTKKEPARERPTGGNASTGHVAQKDNSGGREASSAKR